MRKKYHFLLIGFLFSMYVLGLEMLLLEYIEPICIKAHLEAHVLELYIPTHLGLEE